MILASYNHTIFGIFLAYLLKNKNEELMLSKDNKILIVDDEESMVFSIQDYLSSYAYCLGATSYEEAISLLEKEKDFSLVISDIRMPDKDGFDLLMWLCANRPQVKVVMITAYGSPSVRALAKQKGAVVYLEKPLDLEQLLQVVGQILERKGFSVALKDMELADVLQFLSFANKAAKVQVFNPLGEKGEIGLAGEEVLWIQSGSKKGEEAFYEIMSWEGGSFEVFPLEKEEKRPEEDKMLVPLSFLLLEEARRRDEESVTIGEEQEETIPTQEEAVEIDLAKELARWQTGVDGFAASAFIRMDGTYIAGICNLPNVDLSVPVAYNAKTLNSIVENLNATKRGNWEEILITTDTHYMIWQKLTNDVFLSLTLDRAQGNVGMGRLQIDQLVKKVIGELT
jgi:DNA-binding response OmpR family regulator/predicted regulator of Ras-like GTPase activity (Roadblock/LC7/MglB family)